MNLNDVDKLRYGSIMETKNYFNENQMGSVIKYKSSMQGFTGKNNVEPLPRANNAFHSRQMNRKDELPKTGSRESLFS